MTRYDDLQLQHQQLLRQLDAHGDPGAWLPAAQAYIQRVRSEAEHIADPLERDRLRANLRFWASAVFEHTRAYPETALRPPSVPYLPVAREGGDASRWQWAVLVAGAALVVAVILIWAFAPGARPYLTGLGLFAGLAGVFPASYLAYVRFSAEVQRRRLLDDFQLLGLETESSVTTAVETLYRSVHSPGQYAIYISLIVLVSLLVAGGYLGRGALANVSPAALAAGFYGYLGAYVYSVQALIRRYSTYDLLPQTYSAILARMLLAVIVPMAAVSVFPISAAESTLPGWVAVLAFGFGAFPDGALRWLAHLAGRLGRATPAGTVLPLANLVGMTSWHAARLAQLGIEDAQNLATADLRRLLVLTPFDAQQLVHWIDQAILYVKVGPALAAYRQTGINTFSELRVALEAGARAGEGDRLDPRMRLAESLRLSGPDEIARLAEDLNFPNSAHIAEYYAHVAQVSRARAGTGPALFSTALEAAVAPASAPEAEAGPTGVLEAEAGPPAAVDG